MRLFALALLLAARTYVLEPGVYEKVVVDDAEMWLGVYPSGEVRECRIRVRRVSNDEYSDALVTSVEASPRPLFLVKGSPAVKAGKVTTLYALHEDAPSSIAVTLAGKKYVLETTATRLKLRSGGKETILGECPPRDGIVPVWAGDLDRDGQLDVYFRIEHHNFAVEEMLYLSSETRRPRLAARKFE